MAGGETLLKLRELRTGKQQYKVINLGDVKEKLDIAVVLLSADVMLSINEKVEERYHIINTDKKEDNTSDDAKLNSITRNQYYNILLCLNCVREADDINAHVFSTEEEVGSTLDLEDIKRVCENYNELLVNRAYKLETIKEEDIDEIKKALEVTSLNDLSIVSQVHLAYFLQAVRSEKCQTSNGSGSSSTN